MVKAKEKHFVESGHCVLLQLSWTCCRENRILEKGNRRQVKFLKCPYEVESWQHKKIINVFSYRNVREEVLDIHAWWLTMKIPSFFPDGSWCFRGIEGLMNALQESYTSFPNFPLMASTSRNSLGKNRPPWGTRLFTPCFVWTCWQSRTGDRLLCVRGWFLGTQTRGLSRVKGPQKPW